MEQSDNEYIRGLIENDKAIIQKIYDDYLPRIRNFITKNRGTENDAWEIFQEALIIIMKKAKAANFKLSSNFYTFLYGVCRNLWGNELQKKYRTEVTIDDTLKYKSNTDYEKELIQSEQFYLYREKFAMLRERCQELLNHYFNGKKFRMIANLMGYASESVARKEKHKCQQHLIKSIKADPKFRELNHE